MTRAEKDAKFVGATGCPPGDQARNSPTQHHVQDKTENLDTIILHQSNTSLVTRSHWTKHTSETTGNKNEQMQSLKPPHTRSRPPSS